MTRTTQHDLLAALYRFGNASGLKTSMTHQHDANLSGTIMFSKSPEGYRLVERVGTSGEAALAPAMTAGELVRALDLAADLFRIAAREKTPTCANCGTELTPHDHGPNCNRCRGKVTN